MRHRSISAAGQALAQAIKDLPEATSLAERNRQQLELASVLAHAFGLDQLEAVVLVSPLYALRNPQLRS